MSDREEPRPILLWCLAVLPVLAAYANAVDVGFMWDDTVLIEQNAELHTLHAPWSYLTRSFWQHAFLHGQGHAFYRPLVTYSLALDWAVGGGSTTWFHVTNVLFHLAVCTLVFVIARRRGASGVGAMAATMVFGVMPRLTESVTWIVGRTDVLATLGVLAAVWLVDQPRAKWLAPLALFLALLAKEVAIIGVMLVFVEAALRVREKKSSWRDELPLLALVFVAVVAWWIFRAQVPSNQPLQLHDVNTFLAGLGHYALMTVTPWNPVAQIGFVLEPEVWATVLGLISVVVVGVVTFVLAKSARPWRAVWVLGAFGGVVIVSLVVLTVYTMASDRFLYLPLAMGAVVLAQLKWPKPALIISVVVSLVLAVVTWKHNELWANPLRFWTEVKNTASPRNPGAIAGLGDALYNLNRFEDAKPLYEQAEAQRLSETHSPTRLSLASVDSRLGNDAAAIARLEDILKVEPDWKRAAYALVLFRARAGDFAGADRALINARSKFGDDEVLQSFAKMLNEVPPKLASTEGIERARALHALESTRKAEREYVTLLDDAAHRDEAAKWLVVFGSEPSARRVVEMINDPAMKAEFDDRFP
ncbi:MAG: hypothetical protein ACO1OB_11975 [Archangium sp.]